MIPRSARLVRLYYLTTPVFVVLDVGFGVNLRLAGLDAHPGLRAVWYAAALGCAALVTRRPELSPLVAAVEGGGTVLALVLGVILPYWDLVGRLASEQAAGTTVTQLREGVANLLLTGTVVIVGQLRGTGAAGVDGRGWRA